MGIINAQMWNFEAMGKHVWMITKKKKNLRVKWIHSIYFKEQSWWDYSLKSNDNWYWRAICKVKENMKSYLTEA